MLLLKLGSELKNLIKKIPIRSENINKMQTAFLRSGMHRGVHLLLNPSFFKVTNITETCTLYNHVHCASLGRPINSPFYSLSITLHLP